MLKRQDIWQLSFSSFLTVNDVPSTWPFEFYYSFLISKLLSFSSPIFTVNLTGKMAYFVDIIFILGSSDPNGRLSFAKQKEIAKSIIDLPDTADQRYGVVQYDNYPSIPVRLGYIRDKRSLKDVIDRITWRRDGTAFLEALRQAADQFDKEGRPKAQFEVVLFSDGKIKTTYQELSEIGAMLRKKNISIRIVTTDEDGDRDRMKPLTPDEGGIVGVKITENVTDVIISKVAGKILTGMSNTWQTCVLL